MTQDNIYALWSRWGERGGVILLLFAALIVRARDIRSTFDREFGGYQGAFFAIGAVNYERFGLTRFSGYPAVMIDGPKLGDDDLREAKDDPSRALVYVNHPPLVPLLAWSSLKLFAPRGWNEAWKEHRAPQKIELALRLPFLALHMLGLFAFWWAMKQGFSSRPAMIALALAAALPVSILYGTLVNYENPSLPCVLFALGFYARWSREGRTRDLLATCASFALGSAVTFAPVFFVPAIALHAALRKRWKVALVVAGTCGTAVLAPLLVHAMLARSTGAAPAGLYERARVLLEPLIDGSRPITEWLWVQLDHMRDSFTFPVIVAAALGFVLLSVRHFRPSVDVVMSSLEDAPPKGQQGFERVDIASPMLLGGFLYLLGFYRHTLEDQRIFMLYLAPGVAAFAAVLLDELALPLFRLRAGIAPLVVAASLLVMPCSKRADELRWQMTAPGPRDDPPIAGGPQMPLPATSGAELGALLPPQSLGVYPSSLGFNLAPAFYAWRNLVPIASLYDVRVLRERMPFTKELATYLIMPRDAPESVRAQATALHDALGIAAAPAAQSQRWNLYRIP